MKILLPHDLFRKQKKKKNIKKCVIILLLFLIIFFKHLLHLKPQPNSKYRTLERLKLYYNKFNTSPLIIQIYIHNHIHNISIHIRIQTQHYTDTNSIFIECYASVYFVFVVTKKKQKNVRKKKQNGARLCSRSCHNDATKILHSYIYSYTHIHIYSRSRIRTFKIFGYENVAKIYIQQLQ